MLREQLGERRIRFTKDQRRRLAAKAKALGREGLNEIFDLVTPDTLSRWYRKLIAKKYGRARCEAAQEFFVDTEHDCTTSNSALNRERIIVTGGLRDFCAVHQSSVG